MPARSLKPIQAIAIAVALICLQASGIVIFHSRPWVAWGITYTAMFAVPFCLLVICCWRAWKATYLRLQWVLLALSTFLWLVGFAIRTWSIFFDKGGFAEGNPVLENLSSWVYFYGSTQFLLLCRFQAARFIHTSFFRSMLYSTSSLVISAIWNSTQFVLSRMCPPSLPTISISSMISIFLLLLRLP